MNIELSRFTILALLCPKWLKKATYSFNSLPLSKHPSCLLADTLDFYRKIITLVRSVHCQLAIG